LEALRLDTSKPAFCHGLKPSVVTHRDQIRLLARYEIAALLRRNRMILQMWRQSGLGLRQFGQKKVGLSRNSLYWRLGILEVSPPRFRGS
jgi:hypothetical protein